jgi:hypothetical protein
MLQGQRGDAASRSTVAPAPCATRRRLAQAQGEATSAAQDALHALVEEIRMSHLIARQALWFVALGAACIVALAQGPASAPGPGRGPAAAASAPGPGMHGGMRGWRANRDNTPGWAMMSPAERDEHHRTMQSMTRADECRTYMDKHRAEMVERAKQQGRPAPGAVARRHDPCARLTSGK